MSRQTTIETYTRAERQRAVAQEGADLAPDDSTPDAHRQCGNCGALVSDRFRRVMGDNSHRAHACPQCAGTGDLMNGAAAREDYDLDGLAGRGSP